MTKTDKETAAQGGNKEFLTATVAGQTFGIPVLQVQDVLGEQKVTRVPLARKEIAGSLNLRGRVVTAINLRHKLGMPEKPAEMKTMYVVVEHKGELYSLIVDSVGEVLSLPDKDFEKTPATLEASWRALAIGIYRLKEELLVILDVPAMLEALFVKDDAA
ncbi:MAG: chemotaxis protein CheW [Alphaproteobacteria bacterium]|nr:chemotaxis protein CheW [Alphaproteobacteria bacterium]MDE2337253.1 chemotaxis protein CheW [Alphaproteobacteria bacterium]